MERVILKLLEKRSKLQTRKIASLLNVSESEIKGYLRDLELTGKIYKDEENLYELMPVNFFVAVLNITSKGKFYVLDGKKRIDLDASKLDGALAFDTVVFERPSYKVKKVLDRKIKNVICEVKNDGEHNYLEVCNTKTKVIVTVGHNTIKKLVLGERVLVELNDLFENNIYNGKLLERVGYKDDFDTELKTIAINNGFLTEYPKEVMKELENIPDEVREEDLINRVDKRNDFIFTIDGDYTKDIDDAVELKMLENGNYLLTVSIAHVSHYVKPGSAIWAFAEENTTSLYFANYVMAMLPAKLSNGICSLNPNVDRLARSFELEIDPYGDVVNFKRYLSVIRSKKQMTYNNVNKILREGIVPEGYEEYVDNLKLMNRLSKILAMKRENNGAIDIASREIKYKVNDDGETEKEILSQLEAEKVIEKFMLATNAKNGKYQHATGLPFGYRNHEYPIMERVKDIYELLKMSGYRLEKINFTEDERILQKIIRNLANKEEFAVLSVYIIKSMQKAYYSPENKGHFALAEDYYTQTTSPIRRFLDLVAHTLMDYYDKNPDYGYSEDITAYLKEICEKVSLKERYAQKAEYEANQLFMINYLKDRIGEEFYGFISDINSKYVQIRTTDLMDGYLDIDLIKNGFVYYPESKMLVNKDLNISFHIGSKVKLKLSRIDLGLRQAYFEVMEPNLIEEDTMKRVRKSK